MRLISFLHCYDSMQQSKQLFQAQMDESQNDYYLKNIFFCLQGLAVLYQLVQKCCRCATVAGIKSKHIHINYRVNRPSFCHLAQQSLQTIQQYLWWNWRWTSQTRFQWEMFLLHRNCNFRNIHRKRARHHSITGNASWRLSYTQCRRRWSWVNNVLKNIIYFQQTSTSNT